MNYLNKAASQDSTKNQAGQFELRMNRLYQILGMFGICIAIIFVFVVIYYQEREMYVIGIAMLFLFGGLGVPLLFYYYNHKLIFDEEKITSTGWNKKVKSLSWEEIKKISFNPMSGMIKVEGINSQLKIHQHLVGLKEFVKMMEKKTKWKANELKLPI